MKLTCKCGARLSVGVEYDSEMGLRHLCCQNEDCPLSIQRIHEHPHLAAVWEAAQDINSVFAVVLVERGSVKIPRKPSAPLPPIPPPEEPRLTPQLNEAFRQVWLSSIGMQKTGFYCNGANAFSLVVRDLCKLRLMYHLGEDRYWFTDEGLKVLHGEGWEAIKIHLNGGRR